MTPLIKAGIKMSFKPFGESMFDVACSTYLFLRESHENNEKHDMGYQAKNGHTYNRCGIFAWPSDNVKEKQGVLDITVEKKFRDVCYELLAASSSKIPAEESIAVWDKSHSLTHKTFMQCGRLKSLDEVFIDESVANILFTYYVPSNIEKKKVYQFLVANKLTITSIKEERVMESILSSVSTCLDFQKTVSLMSLMTGLVLGWKTALMIICEAF